MVLILTISTISYGQEAEFRFTKDGLTDYVVTQCEGKKQSEIYKKCIDWIAFTYKNPKIVTQAKIENEYIRIEAISESLICDNSSLYGKICRNGKYTLETSFKDGKYKFEILKIEKFLEATNNSTPPNYPDRWMPVKTKPSDSNDFVYDKGKHIGEIYSSYKYYNEIATYFNVLNKQLKDFVLNKDIPSKKNEW